jgi:hypothetical protein
MHIPAPPEHARSGKHSHKVVDTRHEHPLRVLYFAERLTAQNAFQNILARFYQLFTFRCCP